jgi:hypothetical protein
MFSNALLAGALGAAYLGVLFFQLNPSVPLYPMNFLPLLVTLLLSYGVHLSALYYGALVFREIVAFEAFSPGWLSLRLLSWLFAVDAAAGAALIWLNLGLYAPLMALDTARRMAIGAAVVTGAAFIFLFVALVRYSFGRRRGRVGSSILALTAAASLVVPLLARGPGESSRLASRPLDLDLGLVPSAVGPRVVMILLDGGSLDFISTAALEGKLPNFGKILDSGAAMHLATLRPTQPDPVWTTVATGKVPWKTGVRSSALYRVRAANDPFELLPDHCFAQGLIHFGFLGTIPHSSSSPRVRPLWRILATAGLSAGIVNWPLTHPAQPTRGYLVSPQFYRLEDPSLEPDDPASVYPAEVLPLARSAGDRAAPTAPAPLGPEEIARAVARRRQGAASWRMAPPQPFVVDEMYEQVAQALQSRFRPRLTAVRYTQLDEAGHDFLRFAMPREFGDVTPEERRQYGALLEGAYARVDAIVGRAMATLGSDDLLVVVSGFGMEPLNLGKRLLERAIGNAEISGTHENAPDGFLMAWGRAVAPGRKQRASVTDVAPTLLYFLGMPVARDMDGYARTDVFQRAYTDERPLARIPTYEQQ